MYISVFGDACWFVSFLVGGIVGLLVSCFVGFLVCRYFERNTAVNCFEIQDM